MTIPPSWDSIDSARAITAVNNIIDGIQTDEDVIYIEKYIHSVELIKRNQVKQIPVLIKKHIDVKMH